MRDDLAICSSGEISRGGWQGEIVITRKPGGPMAIFYQQDPQGNLHTIHLYTGGDRYQLWRAYMLALADAEREGWKMSSPDKPKVSDIQNA